MTNASKKILIQFLIFISIIIIFLSIIAVLVQLRHKQCVLVDTKSLKVQGNVTFKQVSTSLLISVDGYRVNDDYLFRKTSDTTYTFVTINEYIVYDTDSHIITARNRKTGKIVTYKIECK